MEDHIIEAEDVLNFIVQKYNFRVEKQEKEKLIVRLPFSSKEEVENFRRELASQTSTEWILYNDSSKRTKCFNKVWICHLSGWKKRSGSKRNAKCNAKLGIKIKEMDPTLIAKDCFLRQDPPLRTVVKISLTHTHTIHSAAALKLLRVPDELKARFFKYFDHGILPGDAISLHESELVCLDKCEDLADSSKNPTHRQVYYMHDQWRLNNFGPCHNQFEKLKENIEEYERNVSCEEIDVGHPKDGVNVEVEEGEVAKGWNVEVIKQELLREHERIKALITQTSSNEVAHHLLNVFKSVQSVDDLKKLTFFRSLRAKKIHVQPMSVSRRRKALTHSRKRVPAGPPHLVRVIPALNHHSS